MMKKHRGTVWAGLVVVGLGAAAGMGSDGPGATPRVGPTVVNWETPHVHPLEMSPDGSTLLAVNTGAATVDVYDLSGDVPVPVMSVPVGLDPVTVRARTNSEVWVVNHVSDSVSIVDLTTGNVRWTLKTLDEPCDVVFAGASQRAFVTCSQANAVQVFDPANLATPPIRIDIDAEDPRALAVSPDGNTVYAAVFESGNHSTLVGGGFSGSGTLAFPPNGVNEPAGPYGGVNPPPNSGTGFNPPIAPGNSPAIKVSLIVKKNDAGQWMDDNDHDWTSMVSGANAGLSGRPVGWNLPDRDVAVIDANSLSLSYATGLMNMCMSVSVNPATGEINVIGTDGTNEIRYEPNVKGRFIRVELASVDAANLNDKSIVDLNPHLTYAVSSIPPAERVKSIGDPRALVWNSAGTKGYIAGMGSNNLIVVDAAGARAGLSDTITVREGPTGLALDESRARLYVLNRFEGSISVVDTDAEIEYAVVPFFDPTPAAIKVGRKHLYDTHRNSGLGQISCASCHVDARMDRLAWDLGNPQGAIDTLIDRNLGFGFPGLSQGTTNPPFQPFHPMKGPMTTQTLQAIIGLEPFHWRGDRLGIENFAGAFVGLQGGDTPLNATDMQEFEDFLATITFPPNPFRNFDNTLPTNLPLPGHYKTGRFGGAGDPLPNGNAVTGLSLYRSTSRRLDGNAFACVTCHTLPTGAGPDMKLVNNVYQPIAVGPMGQHHLGLVSVDGTTNVSIKIPQFRNAYEKSGCNMVKTTSNAGFGFVHDGSVDSIERFVSEPVFTVNNDQEVANLVAFILACTGSELPQGQPNTPFEPPGPPSLDTHAGVGTQTTLVSQAGADPAQIALINSMISLADTNKVGLIVKGTQAAEPRGYTYQGAGVFQSDKAGETRTTAQLLGAAAPGSEMTFTVVPKGTETRLGVDRDLDGCLDADEGVTCDCPADINGDGFVDGIDYDTFMNAYEIGDPYADFNGDGFIDGIDSDQFNNAFEAGC